MEVKCFMTIFITYEDGLKGLTSKQKIAEKVLAKAGSISGEAKVAENLRRVTIYGTVRSRTGETSQQTIDRVAKEISEATERSAVGRPEGWSPTKQ